MATPRTPQDRRQPAKKTTRKTTPSTSTAKKAAKPPTRPTTKKAAAPQTGAARARRASQAALAKSTTGAETPVSSDQLAAEADAAVVRPEGMPEVRPWVSMPRRDRAAWLRIIKEVQEALPAETAEAAAEASAKLEAGDADEVTGQDLELAATSLETLGLLGDALAVTAVDQDEFEAWYESVPDDVAQQAWAWYQQEYPMGEAEASSS